MVESPNKNTMIPQSGIDVIRLTLAPWFFNKEYFKSRPFIDPYNRLTIHQRGMYYTLEIHIEYMEVNEDLHLTMARAIYELICSKYLIFILFNGALNFIYYNLNWFILSVSAIEFYFDLLPNKVSINDDAVENSYLIQYMVNGEGEYSYYSNDYKVKKQPSKKDNDKIKRKVVRHSRVHLYDKYEKNVQDNHISHSVLDEYPYRIRLEFKLSNDNCLFLSLDNFKGTYNQILEKFSPYLGVIYNNYVVGNIRIIGRDNKELAKVVRKSKGAGTRYTGKGLFPTEKIPECVRNGKRDYKEQIKGMILGQKCQNGELPGNVKEYMENMVRQPKT